MLPTETKPTKAVEKSVSSVMSGLMANPAVKSRFDELLGKKKSKFVSALVSLINADSALTEAFVQNPMSVLQVAMKAAVYDLEIGNDLGYAYIVPFRVNGKPSAQFILGYKGLIALAKRSKDIVRLGASVVREGELKSIDYLYGDCEFEWIQNLTERAKKPVIGYVASLKEKSGFEKMVFMSKQEMIEHEEKNRRGQYMSPSWKNHFDSMAMKTVLRKLLTTYASLNASDDDEYSDDGIEFEESQPDSITLDLNVDTETGEIHGDES